MSTENHRQLHFEFVNDENRKEVESLSLFLNKSISLRV